MTLSHDLSSILQELSITEQHLETLESFDAIVSTYEKVFSLIHQGMALLSVKNQQCYILSIQPNGAVTKNTLGQVALQPFVPAKQQ